MEYDFKQVHEACLLNLDNPEHFGKVLAFFHPQAEPRVSDRAVFFKAFLKGLPPAEVQLKIRERFQDIARKREARAFDFRWWDIVLPKERFLWADVIRGNLKLRVGFNWKTTKKGTSPPGNATHLCWGANAQAPGGQSLVIESYTYQEVKAAFRAWLEHPLKLPTGFSDLTLTPSP